MATSILDLLNVPRELTLDFLATFARFEFALKKAGYAQGDDSKVSPDWDSFAIKAGYLEMMRSLEQPVPAIMQQEVGWEYDYRLGDMKLSPDLAGSLDTARRFVLREPERSRRVLRLLCAN